MAEGTPNYLATEPPADKAPAEYTHHERRAEIADLVVAAGSPYAVKQSQLADRYDVHPSTVCRDMKRLREAAADDLAADAPFLSRVVFEKTLRELQDAGDWRAAREAFKTVMEWNEWLGDLGIQDRAPSKHEVAVDLDPSEAYIAALEAWEGADE